ncbi:Histone acetyltransferase [Aphelenchoides besseyi]|nr:Histone acetyltransferase [Aphelenchoides besseyi]
MKTTSDSSKLRNSLPSRMQTGQKVRKPRTSGPERVTASVKFAKTPPSSPRSTRTSPTKTDSLPKSPRSKEPTDEDEEAQRLAFLAKLKDGLRYKGDFQCIAAQESTFSRLNEEYVNEETDQTTTEIQHFFPFASVGVKTEKEQSNNYKFNFGDIVYKPRFFDFLRSRFPSFHRLSFCQKCLMAFESKEDLIVHVDACTMNHPPGTAIYQEGNLIVWEVSGQKEKEIKPTGNNNLSCLLILPWMQRKGYGVFLIDMSYQLSLRERKIGSPEHPLSDAGLKTYRQYWYAAIMSYVREKLYNNEKLDLIDIKEQTGIEMKDLIETMIVADMTFILDDKLQVNVETPFYTMLSGLRRRYKCKNYEPISSRTLDVEPLKRAIAFGKEEKRWSIDRGLERWRSAQFHGATVDALKLHETKNGVRLAISGSRDRSLILWDVGKIATENDSALWHKTVPAAHTGWIWSLCASADDKTIFSCAFDSMLTQWEIADGGLRKINSTKIQTVPMNCLTEGDLLYVSTHDGRILMFDTRLGLSTPMPLQIPQQRHPINCLATVSDSNYLFALVDYKNGDLACGFSEGIVKFWPRENKNLPIVDPNEL